jgi:D-arabinose 1-dehydrogenase-like Zn-dependent alcohol dehydrogenase
VRREGIITLVGIVTGLVSQANPLEALYRIFTIRGIFGGSRAQFEEMMAAIEANKIQPIVDKHRFAFEQLREAMQHLVSRAWSMKDGYRG